MVLNLLLLILGLLMVMLVTNENYVTIMNNNLNYLIKNYTNNQKVLDKTKKM